MHIPAEFNKFFIRQLGLSSSSSSNHVHGTPDHGQQLADHRRRLTEEEEEEEELNERLKWLLKLASLERKAEMVQDLKNLGFSASEDRVVVHKKMKGQVKHFEDWKHKSSEKLNDAQRIEQYMLLIMLAHMYVVAFLRSGLKAICQGSTKNVLIIVELIILIIILSVINIILVYSCHKKKEYWLKLRAKANILLMKVKNMRSNLIYVPRSHLDADHDADYTIDDACIYVARSWANMNVLFVRRVFLLSIAVSFIGFVELWYAWHELTVQW